MSDTFRPGLAHLVAATGERVHRAPYTGTTDQQHAKSLQLMVEKIREGYKDRRIRERVDHVLHAAKIDGRTGATTRQVVGALLEYLRAGTVYVPDPVKTEYVQGAAATLCLAPGLCMRGGDCFPQGTLLLKDDFSLVRIEEIQVGDRIWGKDTWTTVARKMEKGPLALDAIRMNNGSTMLLTSDHHVFGLTCKRHTLRCSCPLDTWEQTRIQVADLKEGQALTSPKRIPFGSSELDPDRAYVEGLHVADGWHEEGRAGFRISGQDGKPKEAQKREVEAICARLGITTRWNRKYIAINDVAWAARVALMGHRAPNKHFLSLNLDEAQAAQSLRGVMADSTANTNGGGRTFSTTSHQLMVQVRVLHRMFGKSTSIRFMTAEQHQGLGQNPIWRVGIRDSNAQKKEKHLRVKEIARSVLELPCWDITTSDGYVYLPEHDVTVSNCDDLVVALCCLVLAAGIPCSVVKESYGADPFSGEDYQGHVLCAIKDEHGEWFYADPSTTKPVEDRRQQAVSRQFIDPLANVALEIIGVGRPPARVWEEQEVAGFGAVTAGTTQIPGTWTNVASNTVVAGLRYAVAISVSSTSGWTVDSVTTYFSKGGQSTVPFLVEQIIPGSGIGAWIMIGLARTAGALSATTVGGTGVNVVAVLQEQPAAVVAAPTSPTGPTAAQAALVAPTVGSVSMGTALLWGLGIAAAGGVVWGLSRRRGGL